MVNLAPSLSPPNKHIPKSGLLFLSKSHTYLFVPKYLSMSLKNKVTFKKHKHCVIYQPKQLSLKSPNIRSVINFPNSVEFCFSHLVCLNHDPKKIHVAFGWHIPKTFSFYWLPLLYFPLQSVKSFQTFFMIPMVSLTHSSTPGLIKFRLVL